MIKIAAVQFSAGPDVKRTLKKAAQFTEVAADKGARIICFPELFAWPWFPASKDDKAFETAEAGPGLLRRSRSGLRVAAPGFSFSRRAEQSAETARMGGLRDRTEMRLSLASGVF